MGRLFLTAAAAWSLPTVSASAGDTASCVAGVDSPSCQRPAAAIFQGGDLEALEVNEYVHLIQQAMLVSRADKSIGVATASDAGQQRATAQHAPALTASQKAKATTTTTTAATTTATVNKDYTGMTMNTDGDFEAFVAGALSNGMTFFACMAMFSVLRVRYPRMYSKNVLSGTSPGPKPDLAARLGWFRASLDYNLEELIESVGLDQGMLLEFTHLCMRILAIIGLPTFFILGPLHYFFGGHAAGGDRLSYLSMGNIESGSWLYWIHAFAVWGVVFVVQTSVYAAQKQFLGLRFKWLRHMGNLRANTVLVEGIPSEHQSDAALKKFFEMIFPGDKVECAYVAKDTKGLVALAAELELARRSLEEGEAVDRKTPGSPLLMRETVMGGKVKAVDHWASEVQKLESKIEELRRRVKQEAAAKVGPGGGNTSSGFVTFRSRCDAELALRLDGVSHDDEEFVISTPPMPDDILWADLTQDDTAEEGRTVTGYLLVAGLYFAYMPLVIGITNIAKSVDLGPLQPMWASLAPTMGLTIMVSFLPTFLKMIFTSFFTLKAAAWAQQKLQIWYFWFQVVFVILATAVGQDVVGFTQVLFSDPMLIFRKMAQTLPFATHFYMNYLVLQCTTHALCILRYVNLSKYLGFKALYEDEEAAAMAEPEDQDYYGIGSRSARWTINMLIGIIFGTLCPPMCLLCFGLFAAIRVIYGYLIPFAETRKADLGGAFWTSQLTHLFYGNMIYVVLMTSVLLDRAANYGPALIAFPSLIYVIWSHVRFQTAFNWEKLPFQELMRPESQALSDKMTKREITGKYMQPELFPEALE